MVASDALASLSAKARLAGTSSISGNSGNSNTKRKLAGALCLVVSLLMLLYSRNGEHTVVAQW